MQINWQQRYYMRKKWPAERARSTVILQWNSSFGETRDQVLFSCRRLLCTCWKVTKYDICILSLAVSLYELFERSTYVTVHSDGTATNWKVCSELRSQSSAQMLAFIIAYVAESFMPSWKFDVLSITVDPDFIQRSGKWLLYLTLYLQNYKSNACR